MNPTDRPIRLALVTDAWAPQMNGVVRTLGTVTEKLRDWGHTVDVISPDQYLSVPCPTYPEIRLAMSAPGSVAKRIEEFAPHAIHISTEGPLGIAARRHCLRRDLPFTTAYHTQFPEYLARRTHMSPAMFWPFIRRFHKPARAIMVATRSMRRQLQAEGLSQLHHWGRGVDLSAFSPDVPPPEVFANLPRPIQLYVGRVAIEKNIEAFLSTEHPGTKVVVGDGPALEGLKAQFPDVHFLGRRSGSELAACYAGADVFVFPSKTDTFGLVMIEAMACGTPVAAYPVTGPIDVLADHVGAMDEHLDSAIASALTKDPKACADFGSGFSWDESARQFLSGLVCEVGQKLDAEKTGSIAA